jgi:shikimate kinase
MGVVLLGYRGSGKTTVGRKLADRLWCEFVDTDEEIVRRAGKSIREIFAEQGEAAFRELESQVVLDALKREGDVISLGGGAILRDENREALAASQHSRIYLRCDPDMLHRRIQNDAATTASRPALTALGGGIDEIKQLLATREPLYRAVATAELDVTNLDPDEAMVRVTKLI